MKALGHARRQRDARAVAAFGRRGCAPAAWAPSRPAGRSPWRRSARRSKYRLTEKRSSQTMDAPSPAPGNRRSTHWCGTAAGWCRARPRRGSPGCARRSGPTTRIAHADSTRPWTGRMCRRCTGWPACRPAPGRPVRRLRAARRRHPGRRGQRQPRRRRIAVQQPDLAQGQAVAIHRRQPGAGGRIRHQQHAGAVLQDVTQLHARDAVLIGTATAPSQPQPSTTDRNSIRLPAISATRSPRRTPWAASSAAKRRVRRRLAIFQCSARRLDPGARALARGLVHQHRRQCLRMHARVSPCWRRSATACRLLKIV